MRTATSRISGDSDVDLVAKSMEGDLRAYATLIDRYKERGMGLALRTLGNRQEAEEALQDAFVKVYRGLPGFRAESKFGTWFYRIVYNTCLTRRRRMQRPEELQPLWEEDTGAAAECPDTPSQDDRPDENYEMREFETSVGEELERLPAMYREALTLFLLQELSYDEVARSLQLTIAATKTRIFRARAMLQAALRARIDWIRPEPVAETRGDD